MHSYLETNQKRHGAGKTYLESGALAQAEKDAAGIAKERHTSVDEVEGDESEGAVDLKPAGKMKLKSKAKEPKPKKNEKSKKKLEKD